MFYALTEHFTVVLMDRLSNNSTYNEKEEGCSSLINHVETEMGMNFGYSDHLVCASSDEFASLSSYMAGINEERFRSILEKQRNPGNGNVTHINVR